MLPLATHCLRGHPRTPENLKANRSCKLCEREREKAKRALNPKPPKTQCKRGHPKLYPGPCKACKREAKKRYLKAHPEISRERKKRYLKRHPEKRWAKSHPEEAKAYNRTYRKTHGNPPRTSEQNRRRLSKRRAHKAGAGGSYTLQEERSLRTFYENRCVCCWRTEAELDALGLRLVLDHVVPVSKGGNSFISNLQPLCHHKAKGTAGCNEYKCDFNDTDYRIEGMLGLS